MSPLEIIAIVFGAGAVLFTGPTFYRLWRRKRLKAKSFSDAWLAIVRKNVPLYERLPVNLQLRLQQLTTVFIGEKHFIPCQNLKLTDEVKVTIAAQACVIQLGRKHNYFPNVSSIYVYPSSYVQRIGGEESVNLGESWQDGRIVLAWDASVSGAANLHDGQNVVIHEFAHQLDQVDGESDGTPILKNKQAYATWARVCTKEYNALRLKAALGRSGVMNRYGATNPAEFFAVATESFFERPEKMKRLHTDLYNELQSYYGLDPASWFNQ